MLLGLIFSILTASFTLSSNNTIISEGDVPDYSEAVFSRSSTTGKRGQMTEGNTTCLSLRGWDGCVIRSVVLEMHSNSKSGAGTLKMTIGKQVVWEIEDQAFSEQAWAGSYSSDWVDIRQDMMAGVGDNENVDIWIEASENSLYINSYWIEYEPAAPRCHTLTFKTGMDTMPAPMSQSEIGAAIVLPAWKDTAEWYFLGWSEVEVVDTKEMGELLMAGSEYIPKKNTTLWAVYSDIKEIVAVSEYQSGDYVLTMWDELTEYYATTGMVMTGAIDNGKIEICSSSMSKNQENKCCLNMSITDDMIYQLDFINDSCLSIVHVNSGCTIGYEGNKLMNNIDVQWNYKVLEDQSLVIYMSYKNPENTYALRFAVTASVDYRQLWAQLQRLDVNSWNQNAFWLFPIVYPQYTSWPFGKVIDDSVEQQENILEVIENGIFLMNIANYKLYVMEKNKKKYLIPAALVP
jgi:hypothetical protein